jgi:hypothetical protein
MTRALIWLTSDRAIELGCLVAICGFVLLAFYMAGAGEVSA